VCLAAIDVTERGSLLRELLDEALTATDVRHFVVDFTGVTHCSSSVINDLLFLRKRVATRNGTLKLCRLSASIRDKFGVLSLTRVFDLVESLEEALTEERGE